MAEYIEREVAIKAIEEVVMAMESWVTDYQAQRHGLMTAITIVTDVPAADVVPVRHGRWIDTDPDTPNWSNRKAGMSFYCSVCKHPAGKHKHSTYKFCPWCGALMDKDGDGE